MNNKEKGFSVVELILVAVLIAILVAIAIPNLLASRRVANEASAIASIRSIHSAQVTYRSTMGQNTSYAPTLLVLGAAGLIDDNLGGAGGMKSGYTFAVIGVNNLYCATAGPTTAGSTGDRYFGVTQEGVILQSTDLPGCAAGGLFTPGSGSAAIQ